ncbi:MAG: HlyD family efflux transporter periplasmic adaptor subunit [Phycisphaerales bacterium]|jgi:hypothetical protein|nr:HlyD family efflux transporter periplasmic adaptor subunit [Phycisphaerales bacterium]MBT7170625.1 HlyD family efflux transporter periplasmic adaptor subunit [Phycisphaerales bacterium]
MKETSSHPPSFATVLIRLLLVAIIVLGGVLVAKRFIDSKQAPKRKQREADVRLVEVMTIATQQATVTLPAMGLVAEAEEIDLTSQVEGKLLSVSPSLVAGGLLRTGEEVARVDPADYTLIIAQRESDVARAERALKAEQGHQRIAQREYEMLKEHLKDEDRELVLRMPQLKEAREALKAAQSRLADAKLDVARTTITSPCNAVVRSESVGVGTLVRNGTVLAKLGDSDVYWVLVSMPVDELRFISVPGFNAPKGATGSEVRVEYDAGWGKGKYRLGRVSHLLGELEPKGRMARLVVTVNDPRCLQPENKDKPQLLLRAYVRVKITGNTLPNVVRLPRRVLRENNTVWLVSDNKLRIVRIQPIFKTRDEVWIVAREGGEPISADPMKGVWVPDSSQPPARVVVTNLSAPVDGMPLRVEGEEPKAKTPSAKPAPAAKPARSEQ